MKRPWRPFKDLELKLEFWKGEAKAWELHQILCEFVGKLVEITYVFLLYVIGEEDPIGFSWLLCWYLSRIADIITGGFSISSVVPFCVYE